MLLDQRRDQILHHAQGHGYVSLARLVALLEVSESTIRRDLDALEQAGQIRRTRGGIAYIGDSLPTLENRVTRAHAEKQKIAKAVAALIEPGESILLDAGSTTLEIARQLLKMDLQVLTTYLPIANLLHTAANIELIFIGGYIHPKTDVALGPIVTQTLSTLHVRKAIMSAGGLTAKGLFNSNTLLVDAQRMMIETADEVIVALDSHKLGRTELVNLCPLDDIDHLVTDDAADPQWIDMLRDHHVSVTLAG